MADRLKRFLSVDLRETGETLATACAQPWSDTGVDPGGAAVVVTPFSLSSESAELPHDFEASLAGLRTALGSTRVVSIVGAATTRADPVPNVRTLPALYLKRDALPALLDAVQTSIGSLLPGLLPGNWIEARLRVEARNGRVLQFSYGGGPKGLAQMLAGTVEHFIIALETQSD